MAGRPSLTALLAVLAIAGYQHRDRLAGLLAGMTGPGAAPDPSEAGRRGGEAQGGAGQGGAGQGGVAARGTTPVGHAPGTPGPTTPLPTGDMPDPGAGPSGPSAITGAGGLAGMLAEEAQGQVGPAPGGPAHGPTAGLDRGGNIPGPPGEGGLAGMLAEEATPGAGGPAQATAGHTAQGQSGPTSRPAMPDAMAGLGGVGAMLSEGLRDLMERFRQAGQGEAAESWVGRGPNRDVSATQLAQALGEDTLAAIARQTGLPRSEILSRLTRELPTAVDRYTPEGRLPDA